MWSRKNPMTHTAYKGAREWEGANPPKLYFLNSWNSPHEKKIRASSARISKRKGLGVLATKESRANTTTYTALMLRRDDFHIRSLMPGEETSFGTRTWHIRITPGGILPHSFLQTQAVSSVLFQTKYCLAESHIRLHFLIVCLVNSGADGECT